MTRPKVVGVGVAACAVCCAGPIVAIIGTLGLAGLSSTFVIGWIGLLVVAETIVAYIVLRRRQASIVLRRRQASCAAPATTVNVATPTRRTPQTTQAR